MMREEIMNMQVKTKMGGTTILTLAYTSEICAWNEGIHTVKKMNDLR